MHMVCRPALSSRCTSHKSICCQVANLDKISFTKSSHHTSLSYSHPFYSPGYSWISSGSLPSDCAHFYSAKRGCFLNLIGSRELDSPRPTKKMARKRKFGGWEEPPLVKGFCLPEIEIMEKLRCKPSERSKQYIRILDSV